MSIIRHCSFLIAVTVALVTTAAELQAVTLGFAGSHLDIGGTLFPGGGPADVQNYWVVPWRSEFNSKPLDADGNDVYGSAGYALFATTSTYPNANLLSGEQLTIEGDDLFPNLIDLPAWVADSQILSSKMVGGYGYSLIDDPQLVNGYRDFNWGDSQSPPANPPHSQSPYVKIGILDGGDVLGNSDPKAAPAARWGFEVGENAPAAFRVGVMADGLDGSVFAPIEITLTHAIENTPQSTISSGDLIPNRFVDVHLFDIVGAQPGDQFVFAAKAGNSVSWSSAGIAGFTFDLLPAVAAVSGDYNNDGVVNAADYTVWRDHLGQTFQLDNEGEGQSPGEVTIEDYDFWKSQFGMGGGGSVTSASVPEPASALLLIAATLIVAAPRRGRRS
jgi:hypothetical protein